METMAIAVFNAVARVVEDNNCWTAYDKCESALSAVNDLKKEIKRYQEHLEKACENE